MRLGRSIGLAAALCLAATAALAAPSYTVSPLTPTNLGSVALAVNQSGQSVGHVFVGSASHAFFNDGANFVDLGTLGGDYGQAISVNNLGEIVGSSWGPDNSTYRAFIYRNGAMTDLNTLIDPNLGWELSAAWGINDAGQIAGWGMLGGVQRGFLLDNGVITDMGGPSSVALSINALGQTTGAIINGVSSEAFIYSGGTVTPLGPPMLGGYHINDLGEVAGVATPSDPALVWVAALYSGGNVTELGAFNTCDASEAHGINNHTAVVGMTFCSAFAHAFLWQNGALQDLNAMIPAGSGWELVDAEAINDAGQIVGWGLLNGQFPQAFILTPQSAVPEPSLWMTMMLGCGLAGAALRRRRRYAGLAASRLSR